MTSIFPLTKLSSETAPIEEVKKFQLGRQPHIAFAEVHDDGSRKFPDLEPDFKADGATLRERFENFSKLAQGLALLRDAQHGAATRGELLGKSVVTRQIAVYDLVNISTQAGL